VFADALPNCLIWRYELGNLSHNTAWAHISQSDKLAHASNTRPGSTATSPSAPATCCFSHHDYTLNLQALASVGWARCPAPTRSTPARRRQPRLRHLVHRAQRPHPPHDLVRTRRAPPAALLPHHDRLIARRIRPFDETNWWHWGRGLPRSSAPRIYVNSKTRQPKPFFLHPCNNFDGAVLGVFPHRPDVDLAALCEALNAVDWGDLGFVCDGRYIFSQRSLANAPLPDSFRQFLPEPA
jgi:adenine-specific DNA-methyltransferase